MKLGIISDTHDQVDNILKMVELLNKEEVELVIHCGDWVAPFLLKFYKELKAPIKGVLGNNDGEIFRHLKNSETNKYGVQVEYEHNLIELELDGRKLAALHGDPPAFAEALILTGKYDAVFHGHTHQKRNEMVGDTLALNPGSLFADGKGGDGAGFAVYDTEGNTARFVIL